MLTHLSQHPYGAKKKKYIYIYINICIYSGKRLPPVELEVSIYRVPILGGLEGGESERGEKEGNLGVGPLPFWTLLDPILRPQSHKGAPEASKGILQCPKILPKWPLGPSLVSLFGDFVQQGHLQDTVREKVTKRTHFVTPSTSENHDFALKVLQNRYFHPS